MSNLEVARRFADLLESGDVKGLKAFLVDNFRAQGRSLKLTKPQALRYLQIFFSAFPDHRLGFADFEMKWNFIHCTDQETGTHLGVLDMKPFVVSVSLPPTGKSFKMLQSIFTFCVVGDKVTYYGEEVTQGGGMAGILEQLEVPK